MNFLSIAAAAVSLFLMSCSNQNAKSTGSDTSAISFKNEAKNHNQKSAISGSSTASQNKAGVNNSDSAKAKRGNENSNPDLKIADAQTILSRKQVPILCYHHIRNLKPGKKTRDYEVTPEEFAEQMKALSSAGYKTILPDQLYAYLASGANIPQKSVMITFDDTDAEQFTIGKVEMEKYQFKGVFFIMTISIGRPNYLTKDQIKQLSDAGNSICCHTWDHHMVTKYSEDDWKAQLIKPRKKLEDIIGHKIDYFAYPFGLWNDNAVTHLKDNSIKMAFQLASKRSQTEPLYTVRRILVPGSWSVQRLMKSLETDFQGPGPKK